ncbi:MAG: hypothetical protein KAU94_06500, partial [Verrucomicrobia bacterium]|nr:hypothetical protein [Verrucomicrobiota bacterium]
SATAVDIDGVAGSATIDFVSGYNFTATSDASGFQDATQNSEMMRRAIRIGGTGDSFSISGLGTEYTAQGYDVYVYFGTDNHTRTHRFLVGGTAVSGKEQATAAWQGSFIQTSADADVGNYMVASGLTASSFTILDNLTAPGKGGITGIEIVNTSLIQDFSSDQTSVVAGSTVTLSWQAPFADTLSIDQGIGDVTGLTSTQVVVNAATTYTLMAIGGGTTNTASVAVSLISTPPVVQSFTISSTNVLAGSEVTLSWQVDEATTLSIDQGIGDVTGLTSTQVVVSVDATYTLTATNIHGTDTASVTVTLITTPPVIQSFTSTSLHVFPDSPEVTLSWQVDDATVLGIDQGIGDVTGITSTQIVISASATYTLTASNVNGSSTESIEITLHESPVLFSSSFDGNTGAYVFAGSTDNELGFATLGITDWTTDASVTAISDLTAISTTSGGFAQTQGGTATYANGDAVYISRNLNLDTSPQRGFSLTFTTGTQQKLAILKILSGISNNTGLTDHYYTTDLTYSLSGGTLGAPVTGTTTEDYSIGPAYHTVDFDLTGTTIGAGTYTLEVYQSNMDGLGCYAIYDGILLAAYPRNAATISGSSGPVSGGTEMAITWGSDIGASYTVETNSNLIISGNWKPFMSSIAGTGGEITITNAIGPDQTFYRVITE